MGRGGESGFVIGRRGKDVRRMVMQRVTELVVRREREVGGEWRKRLKVRGRKKGGGGVKKGVDEEGGNMAHFIILHGQCQSRIEKQSMTI